MRSRPSVIRNFASQWCADGRSALRLRPRAGRVSARYPTAAAQRPGNLLETQTRKILAWFQTQLPQPCHSIKLLNYDAVFYAPIHFTYRIDENTMSMTRTNHGCQRTNKACGVEKSATSLTHPDTAAAAGTRLAIA
eukprot:6210554-Pleurochrysis_carterae.AAC.1